MQVDIEVQDLPGIGRRYQLYGEYDSRIAVVIHNTGRRDIYAFERAPKNSDDDDENAADAIVLGRDAIPAPEPSEVLAAGDRLVVVGRREDLSKFTDLVGA